MNANVSCAVDGSARFAFRFRDADEWGDEELFGLGKEFFDTPIINEVFEASLPAIGAIAMLDEDSDHGCSRCDCLVRTQEDAAVCSELTMTGDTAKQNSKVNAGWNAAAFANLYG